MSQYKATGALNAKFKYSRYLFARACRFVVSVCFIVQWNLRITNRFRRNSPIFNTNDTLPARQKLQIRKCMDVSNQGEGRSVGK